MFSIGYHMAMSVMFRWGVLIVGGIAVVVCAFSLWTAGSEQLDLVDPQRNIILIVVDTLRADHVGLYGYEHQETTPNIDRFSQQGRWFESAWSMAPWTIPSVMSLMTSLNPSVHGFNLQGHRFASVVPDLAPSIRTLAEVLQSNGYRTHAVTGGGGVGSIYGFDRGFDSYYEPENLTGDDVESGVARAVEWIESVGDERFFLFFHTYEVHLPNTHNRFESRADPADQAIAAYDSDLAFADQHLNRLFEALENQKRLTGTLVVITADHGENIHDRVLGNHPVDHGHHLHDELLHVPLVFVAPGLIPAGGGLTGPVQLTDVMPTILSLVGVPFAGLSLQGTDLRGWLQDWQPGRANRPVFAGAPLQGPTWHMVRTKDAKFMLTPSTSSGNWWDSVKPDAEALYLLDVDPFERKNVYASQPMVAAGLHGVLRQQLDADFKLRQRFGPVSFSEIDDEKKSQLVELGYIVP